MRRNRLSLVLWLSLVGLFLVYGFYNIKALELQRKLSRFKKEHYANGRLEQQVLEIHDEVFRLKNSLDNCQKRLFANLKRSTSRDDFPVSRGPQIVIYPLEHAHGACSRCVFYLPPGNFSLLFATTVNPSSRREHPGSTSVSPVESKLRFDIEETPGVYEASFEFLSDHTSEALIGLRGPSDKMILEKRFVVNDSDTDCRIQPATPMLVFPGECELDGSNGRLFASNRISPVTLNLFSASLSSKSGSNTTIQATVVCDARRCVPVYEVARKLFSESISPAAMNSQRIQCEELFEPYDGNGLFTLRAISTATFVK